MNDNTKHILWIFVLVVLVLLSISIINLNKTSINKSEDNYMNTCYSKTLENTIHNILKYRKEQLGIIRRLGVNDNRLFFMYSNSECSTCIDHALVDLYVLSKDNKLSKKIIVITPELDDREIRKLSLKYDNSFKFISLDQEAWDYYSTALNGINSIYFVTNSDLSVADCYIFNPHNDKSNQLYYDFIKRKYNF